MNYHLYSNAIIVKSNLTTVAQQMTKQDIYFESKDYNHLLVLHFDNIDKNKGYVSVVNNTHLLPADSRRIVDYAVDFFLLDGYMILFTASPSTALQSLLRIRECFPDFRYEIIKHPIEQDAATTHFIENFIHTKLKYDKIIELTLDSFFGFKVLFRKESKAKMVKYYTNGLVQFGMHNDKKHIEDICRFIINLDLTYKKEKDLLSV
ncbi:hypothetical protein [Bacillus toyonensis]|uniref:hypothetical protein n=1 Tax=Bacillus toyonensis TaxID=155322 RepID=UPI002E219A14|nr:hypothetical protein [Bacillus toyonensis]